MPDGKRADGRIVPGDKGGVMKEWVMLGLGCVAAVMVSLVGCESRAEAFAIGQLDMTSGAVNWDGREGRILDRLFARDGVMTVGAYQSMTEIVDPITRGHKTYSLFTSGMNGASAPSATISGASITVDLSSLFFVMMRGSQVQALNIGGVAQGVFNPETSEFSLSWNHLFRNHAFEGSSKGLDEGEHHRVATFFLQGTAVGLAPTPIAVPASLVLFVSGFAGIGGLAWRNRRLQKAGAAA